MSQILWSWETNSNPNSGVNYRPLTKGSWDGTVWDNQSHRCSNNIPINGPFIIPDFYVLFGPITWSIISVHDDPAQISFDVEIDEPGTDLTILRAQNIHKVVGSANDWATNKGVSPEARGFYISNVKGATAPFSIIANVPDPVPVQ